MNVHRLCNIASDEGNRKNIPSVDKRVLKNTALLQMRRMSPTGHVLSGSKAVRVDKGARRALNRWGALAGMTMRVDSPGVVPRLIRYVWL